MGDVAGGTLAPLLWETPDGRTVLTHGWVVMENVIPLSMVKEAQAEIAGYMHEMCAVEGQFLNTHGLFQNSGTGGLAIDARVTACAAISKRLFGDGVTSVGSLDAIAWAPPSEQKKIRNRQEKVWRDKPDVLEAFEETGEDAPGVTTWPHVDAGIVEACRRDTEIGATGAWRTKGGRSMPYMTYPDNAADTIQAYVQLSEDPTHGTVVFEGKEGGHLKLWGDLVAHCKTEALAGKKNPDRGKAKPENFYMLRKHMSWLAQNTCLKQPVVPLGGALLWLSTLPHGGATRPEGELKARMGLFVSPHPLEKDGKRVDPRLTDNALALRGYQLLHNVEQDPTAVPNTSTHSAVAPEIFPTIGRVRCPQDAADYKRMQERAKEYYRFHPRDARRAKLAETLILGTGKRARELMDALCTKKDETKAKRARAKVHRGGVDIFSGVLE